MGTDNLGTVVQVQVQVPTVPGVGNVMAVAALAWVLLLMAVPVVLS